MGDYNYWLITILYGKELIRVALKVHRSLLKGDCDEYPMEPENREQIQELLPEHVRSCGPIVEIDRLFDISERTE